jgi:hypothetical protein
MKYIKNLNPISAIAIKKLKKKEFKPSSNSQSSFYLLSNQ